MEENTFKLTEFSLVFSLDPYAQSKQTPIFYELFNFYIETIQKPKMRSKGGFYRFAIEHM